MSTPIPCRRTVSASPRPIFSRSHLLLDKGPIIAQGSFATRSGMSLKEIVAAGQKLEATVLVKAIKLYLTKRLDVYWGIVKEV